ncbi:MAG: bifunctional riboflavin kinase/FAD synthetase [Verrucomicrobiota bacterium]
MNLLTEISGLSQLSGPLHLAIGVFDGVHLGHQAVVRSAQVAAEESGGTAVVVTFDPHPITVLSPKNAPRLLTSTQHQALILKRQMGLTQLLTVRFDRDFSEQPGEAFIRDLCKAADVASISVGKDWRFGRGRDGNVQLLEKLGAELGFRATATELVEASGSPVSSTRIREAIAAGDFRIAHELLGRNYTVLGTVIKGRQIGRTIGFPTANLRVFSEQLPPTGVYAVSAVCDGETEWNGVANLGYRPTVEGGTVKRLLEVYLFGLDSEIYDSQLEVTFIKHLRGEKKFDGLDALKSQIQTDIEAAKTLFQAKN